MKHSFLYVSQPYCASISVKVEVHYADTTNTTTRNSTLMPLLEDEDERHSRERLWLLEADLEIVVSFATSFPSNLCF